MVFDVGCLSVKEDLEVTPNFGACGLVSPGITWQVEQSSVFNGKVYRSKDIFLSEWLFYIFGKYFSVFNASE